MADVERPEHHPPSIAGAYACLAMSMTIVGLYVGLSPLLVAAFPVLLLAWLRFGLAALAMPHWLRASPTDPSLSGRDHALLFLQSLLGNFLFTLCALHGASLAGALSAGVVMAGIPACVALLSRVFLKEPLSARVWMATACTGFAVGLLAWQRHAGAGDGTAPLPAWADAAGQTDQPAHEDGLSSLLGHALLLMAVVCEASYVVIGKKLSARVSPRRVSAIINLWGLALSTPMGLWLALDFDFGSVRPQAWGLLAFYAWAASMVTVWLWMKGLQRVPAQQAGIFTVLLPLAAAAVGVGLLGEPWSTAHALALVLALFAVWLVTQPGRGRAQRTSALPDEPHAPS